LEEDVRGNRVGLQTESNRPWQRHMVRYCRARAAPAAVVNHASHNSWNDLCSLIWSRLLRLRKA